MNSSTYIIGLVRFGGIGTTRYETELHVNADSLDEAIEKAIIRWVDNMAFGSRYGIECKSWSLASEVGTF